MDYYIPRTKDELVKFFVVKMGYHAGSLQRMAKSQLYAIYHKVMRDKSRFTSNFTMST